ncbi:MAG: hypothetical protein KDE59_33695 [Anaerolineales bacterium]|nr:hypothetical protein [Anaerolineales bacterium]
MKRNAMAALAAGLLLVLSGAWVGLNRPGLAGLSLLPGFALLSSGAWLWLHGLPREGGTGRLPTWWRNGLLTVIFVAILTGAAFWVLLSALVHANP